MGAVGGGGPGGQEGAPGGPTTTKPRGVKVGDAGLTQIDNERLYTLSRYSGLSVLDVTKADVKNLGHFSLVGAPFELYVNKGMAYAIYSAFPASLSAVPPDQKSGGVVVIDAKTPSAIKVTSVFEVDGEVTDARRVGDRFYLVSHRESNCPECSESTAVLSLDASDPTKVVKTDELVFTAPKPWMKVGRRSVYASGTRMFIAGPDWNDQKNASIQLVDLSDPTGKLAAGAKFAVPGQISDRWQLHERNDVLRVISQRRKQDDSPRLLTFKIQSAQSVPALAEVPMVLPDPKLLRTARFDADRAYVVTTKDDDPILVADFSDPSAPKQIGELKIPGRTYRLEPRGDRAFALTFDPNNAEGSLQISLLDVADMGAPKLLNRVAFGAPGALFPEDEERIQAALSIDAALGRIAIPYRGAYDCSGWKSGVQLFSFDQDSLKKAGSVPAKGPALQSFLQPTRMLTVSESTAQIVDIGNVDAPVGGAEARLATVIGKTIVVGERVARLGANWWTLEPQLHITTLAQATSLDPSETLPFSKIFPSAQCDQYSHLDAVAQRHEFYSDGTLLFVVRQGPTTEIAAIDVSGASAVVKSVAVLPPAADGEGYFGRGSSQEVIDPGKPWVAIGRKLAFLKSQIGSPSVTWLSASLEVVDFSTPTQPKTMSVMLPTGQGFTGLHAEGSRVWLGRWEPSPTDPDKVRFYVERVELGTAQPQLQAPINVPGSLLSVGLQGNTLLTLGYQHVVEPIPYDACVEEWGKDAAQSAPIPPEVAGAPGADAVGCAFTQRTINRVSLGKNGATLSAEKVLSKWEHVGAAHLGADRLFASTWCRHCGPDGTQGYGILVIAGRENGNMTVAKAPRDGNLSPMLAESTRLVVEDSWRPALAVLDAKDPESPSLGPRIGLPSPARQLTQTSTGALCAHSEHGASWVQLAGVAAGK